jgi:hypothetical protein
MPFQMVKSNFHVPLLFFRPAPTLFHPHGPIDTKSFSTCETTGMFVLVKFESNRSVIVGERKVGQTDVQTDIILTYHL